MDIKKRITRIESAVENKCEEEAPDIFIKNLTGLVDKEKFLAFRYDKMIQEVIIKAKL